MKFDSWAAIGFRTIYCGLIFLQIFWTQRFRIQYEAKRYVVWSWDYFQVSLLGVEGFVLLKGLLLLSLLFAAVGCYTRVALGLASVLSFLFFYPLVSDYDPHTLGMIPLTLLFLIVIPHITGSWWKALVAPPKPIEPMYKKMLIAILAVTYLQAAISKLNGGATSWFTGETIRSNMMYLYLSGDSPVLLYLAESVWFSAVLAILVFTWEAGFMLTVFSKKFWPPFVFGGILFHLCVLILLDINFFFCYFASYIIFLNWEKVGLYLRGRLVVLWQKRGSNVLAQIFFFVFCFSLFGNRTQATVAPGKVGAFVENFALLDQNGNNFELYRQSNFKAIVLYSYGVGCPIARKYIQTLNQLATKFNKDEYSFRFIDSNLQNHRERVFNEANEFKIEIPILLDRSQVVAKSLGITRTCEAIIIDPKTWTTVYRGAVDDRVNYVNETQKARQSYLEEALREMKAGKKVTVAGRPALGCAITFKENKEVTFSEVAPVLARRCGGCHQNGGPEPMVLNKYQQLFGWSKMIKEVIVTGRMPPLSIDPLHGHYDVENLLLTDDEKKLIVDWVDLGSPRGSLEEVITPFKEKETPKKWKNDFSVKLRAHKSFELPANKGFIYNYRVLAGPLPEDWWVKGFYFETDNRRVTHHVHLMALTEEQTKNVREYLRGKSRTQYMLSENTYISWRPQRDVKVVPPSETAIVFPKGSYVVLEEHLESSGRPETVKIDVYLDKFDNKNKKFRRVVTDTISATHKIQIPPFKKGAVYTQERKYDKEIQIHRIKFHMHQRGVSEKLVKIRPNGEEETLLSVPDWNMKRVAYFEPKAPIKVEKGSILKIVGEFDNSTSNPANPDPSKWVHGGMGGIDNEMLKAEISYIEEP